MKIKCSVGKGEMEHTACLDCANEGHQGCGMDLSVLRALYEGSENREGEIHVTDLTGCLRKSYLDKMKPVPDYPHKMLSLLKGNAIHHLLESYNDVPNGLSEAELELAGVKGRLDLAYRTKDGRWRLVDYKCQPTGELVTMADGTEKPIEEIKIFDRVLSLGDHGFTSARVTTIMNGGIQDVFRVRLASGQTIRCSGNHPILTDRGFIQARDIQVGKDRVRSLTNWSANGSISSEDARLLGYLVGDGGTAQKSTVKFSNKDEEIYSDAEAICTKKGWVFIKASSDEEPNLEWRIHNRGKQDASGIAFIREHGLYLKHSWEKEVPNEVMSGNTEAIANFIAGYFDCDGYVSEPKPNMPPRITMITTSESLSRQISELLRRLGISNRVGRYASSLDGSKTRDAYHIMVWRASQIIRFAEIVPFRSHKKRKRFGGWMARLREIRARGGKNLSRVESVTSLGPMQTIGLEIEGTHTYISQGIVTHNTAKELYPELVPYGEHEVQVNIYAYMLEQVGGPKVDEMFIQYIGMRGQTECRKCRQPVEWTPDGYQCLLCGKVFEKGHLGALLVPVRKYPAKEIQSVIEHRRAILADALTKKLLPAAEPGWLCKYCQHVCDVRPQ